VVLLINLFIIFSFIYNKFEYGFFNKQGEKLKLKEKNFRKEEKQN
jgi:hypothetical protein